MAEQSRAKEEEEEEEDDSREVGFGRDEPGPVVAEVAEEGGVLRAEPVEGLARRRQVVVDAGDAVLQQPHGEPFTPLLRPPLQDLVGEPLLRGLPVVVGTEERPEEERQGLAGV